MELRLTSARRLPVAGVEEIAAGRGASDRASGVDGDDGPVDGLQHAVGQEDERSLVAEGVEDGVVVEVVPAHAEGEFADKPVAPEEPEEELDVIADAPVPLEEELDVVGGALVETDKELGAGEEEREVGDGAAEVP